MAGHIDQALPGSGLLQSTEVGVLFPFSSTLLASRSPSALTVVRQTRETHPLRVRFFFIMPTEQAEPAQKLLRKRGLHDIFVHAYIWSGDTAHSPEKKLK